jgi:hypothetical protein
MPESGWNLAGFDEWVDLWISRDAPDQDTRHQVRAWLITRIDDPYEDMELIGVTGGLGHPNLWGGWVPGTVWDFRGVYCSCMIFPATGTVRCDSLATLAWP